LGQDYRTADGRVSAFVNALTAAAGRRVSAPAFTPTKGTVREIELYVTGQNA